MTRADKIGRFDAEYAIPLMQNGEGIYVYLTPNRETNGYVIHRVVDNLTYCGDLPPIKLLRLDAENLQGHVQGACEEMADVVREWGLRRPGTSRLKKQIAEMVRDAMADRVELDELALAGVMGD